MNFFRKLLPNKSLATILSIGILVFFAQSHFAHAGFFSLANIAIGVINEVIATLVNIAQYVVSFFLMFAGLILNFSVNLTLNIKQFVNDAPAVFATWKALRDISGLFIIFGLLYAAIQLITGIKKPNFNDLIKNIVLAGVLINFSFFFAGLGIDLSNMVSVQLYNAIAPKSSLNASNLGPDKIGEVAIDGGLSEVFMSAMKMPSFISGAGATKATTDGSLTMIRIILVGFVNIVVMMTAICSFLAASIMFIFRFVILIFLLAFSPIWFMSFILPDLKKYSDDWIKYYKGMLLIMPVYFILLYMSLNVLTNTKYFASNDTGTTAAKTVAYNNDSNSLVGSAIAATTAGGTESRWYTQLLGLAVNAVLVIFMMNVPLMGAISVGGKLAEMIPGTKALSGGKVLSFVGRNTAGRAADTFSKSSFARSLYSSKYVPSVVGNTINKSASAISSAGWGGGKEAGFDAVKKQKIKDYSELARKSNYTEEEAAEIAESERKSDTEYRDLGKKVIEQHREMNKHQAVVSTLEAKLRRERDPSKRSVLTTAINTAKQDTENQKTEIESTKTAMKNREEAINKEVKTRRQNEAAKNYAGPSMTRKVLNKITNGKVELKNAHSQSTGRAIAKEILEGKSKEKKLYEDMMKALKEDGAKTEADKPKSDNKSKTP